jgi:hypothetical protein
MDLLVIQFKPSAETLTPRTVRGDQGRERIAGTGEIEFMQTFSRIAFFVLMLCIGPLCVPQVASQQEDAAADSVATAFMNIRNAAHLPKPRRMGGNTLRKQACSRDLRFPSGFIKDVIYETADPNQLPESARQLAVAPDSGKTAARLGIGVCSIRTNPAWTTDLFHSAGNLRGSRYKFLAYFVGIGDALVFGAGVPVWYRGS